MTLEIVLWILAVTYVSIAVLYFVFLYEEAKKQGLEVTIILVGLCVFWPILTIAYFTSVTYGFIKSVYNKYS